MRGNQFGNLFGPAGPADWNSSQRVHQAFPGGFRVGPRAFCKTGDETLGCRRFDEAGGDRIHADASRPDFLRRR